MAERKEHIIAYFDGACAPYNPAGFMGMGMYIEHFMYGDKWFDGEAKNYSNSNNVAEYLAVIGILKRLENVKGEVIKIYGDSQLVVKQMTGEWKIKEGRYMEHALLAKALLKNLEKHNIVVIRWIPRYENVIADDLSNEGVKLGYQKYSNSFKKPNQ